MSAIILEKQWRHKPNRIVTAGADITATGRAVILEWIDAHLSAGTWYDSNGNAASAPPAFVCAGSGNAVTAAMDGVNRLTTPGDIIMAATTSPHSWIVWTDPVSGVQMCFDFNTTTVASAIRVCISPAGLYTGGSTTARPTAADEHVFSNLTAWGLSLTNVNNGIHFSRSVDGELTLVRITRNGWTCANWIYGKITDASEGMGSEFFIGKEAVSTAAPSATGTTYGFWTGSSFLFSYGSGAAALGFTQQQNAGKPGQTTQLQAVNTFSGKWPLHPMGVVCIATSNIGILGRIADICAGPIQISGGAATDYNYYGEASGSYEWVHFGSLVCPWPKSIAPDFGAGSPTYLGVPEVAKTSGSGQAVYYVMQANDSVTDDLYTWPSGTTKDWAGDGYPGPNSPQNIAISSKR